MYKLDTEHKVLTAMNTLDNLIQTMFDAKASSNELNMQTWITTSPGAAARLNKLTGPGSECGTDACICGFVAIQANEEELGQVKDKVQDKVQDKLPANVRDKVLLSRAAVAIATNLDEVFGNALANSIYASGARNRYSNAVTSGYFTDEELTHKFLGNYDSYGDEIEPSFNCAISYMQMVKQIIGEIQIP